MLLAKLWVSACKWFKKTRVNIALTNRVMVERFSTAVTFLMSLEAGCRLLNPLPTARSLAAVLPCWHFNINFYLYRIYHCVVRRNLLECCSGIDFLGWRAGRLNNRGSITDTGKRVHIVCAVRTEHGANHLFPNRAVITNEWSCSSTPRRHLRSVYRDNFVFIVFVFFICLFIFVHSLMSVKVSGSKWKFPIIYALSCITVKVPRNRPEGPEEGYRL
jgi:hypothetical protein